jgi:plastocyanin
MIAGVVLLACSATLVAAQARRKPVRHTVTIDATRFQPESVTIMAGDIVVWINKDLIPHTASSQAGSFDSGTIAAGASWQQTFTGKGSFGYVCSFHPTMKGRLQVN